MTAPLNFFFDECVSDLAMRDIATVASRSFDGCQFKHIKEFWALGTVDEVLVPMLVAEHWIMVSGDRGKQKSKGEKLRIVCKQNGITLVELSQKIHHMPTSLKSATIAAAWPDFMKLADAPPGSRHLLRLTGSRSAIMVQIDPPPSPLADVAKLVDDAAKPPKREAKKSKKK